MLCWCEDARIHRCNCLVECNREASSPSSLVSRIFEQCRAIILTSKARKFVDVPWQTTVDQYTPGPIQLCRSKQLSYLLFLPASTSCSLIALPLVSEQHPNHLSRPHMRTFHCFLTFLVCHVSHTHIASPPPDTTPLLHSNTTDAARICLLGPSARWL